MITDVAPVKNRVPKQWMVLIQYDPTIPMEFNVSILMTYFNKQILEAHQHAIEVMQTGITTAGTYTYEVAESKMSLVAMVSRENNVPLRLVMAPVIE